MEGIAPDQAKSAVQYEKGWQLLHQLEVIAGESTFQQFMQRFIQKYREQSVTSKDFTDTFEEFISHKFANETKAKIEIFSQLKWD